MNLNDCQPGMPILSLVLSCIGFVMESNFHLVCLLDRMEASAFHDRLEVSGGFSVQTVEAEVVL